MAPVKKSKVGQSGSTVPVAGVGVVQREIKDGIEFSYEASAGTPGGAEVGTVGDSGADRFEGHPLPGLSTEYIEEKEKANQRRSGTVTPRVVIVVQGCSSQCRRGIWSGCVRRCRRRRGNSAARYVPTREYHRRRRPHANQRHDE